MLGSIATNLPTRLNGLGRALLKASACSIRIFVARLVGRIAQFCKVEPLQLVELRAHNAHAHNVLVLVRRDPCLWQAQGYTRRVRSCTGAQYLVDLHENEQIIS